MHTHGSGAKAGHAHGRPGSAGLAPRLAATLGLVVVYMAAEVVGGLLTNSLALLADAGHMLSDAAALGLSLFALWVARRPPDPRRTYGYYRAEILAALANGATLVAIALFIFVEAYGRLGQPPAVLGLPMMAVAAGGLAVNLVGLWVLGAGRSESLNVRGAWLHVLTDALGSVAALGAGALVWGFGWDWADPVASVLIGLLVVYSSWELLREAVTVLMEGAPGHLDVDEVRDALLGLPGVRGVHDLHVWTITSGLESLSAHVVVGGGQAHEELLRRARAVLHERFEIDHVTLQLEPEGFEEHRSAVCLIGGETMQKSDVALRKVLTVGGEQVIHVALGRGEDLRAYLAAHGVRSRVSRAAATDYERVEVEGDTGAGPLQTLVDGWAG